LNDEEQKQHNAITAEIRKNGFAEWCPPQQREWVAAISSIVIGLVVAILTYIQASNPITSASLYYLQHISLGVNTITGIVVARFAFRVIGLSSNFFKIDPAPLYLPDLNFKKLTDSLVAMRKDIA
jgi:multisubunit Na+/H+ antiporter MnhB subunit